MHFCGLNGNFWTIAENALKTPLGELISGKPLASRVAFTDSRSDCLLQKDLFNEIFLRV